MVPGCPMKGWKRKLLQRQRKLVKVLRWIRQNMNRNVYKIAKSVNFYLFLNCAKVGRTWAFVKEIKLLMFCTQENIMYGSCVKTSETRCCLHTLSATQPMQILTHLELSERSKSLVQWSMSINTPDQSTANKLPCKVWKWLWCGAQSLCTFSILSVILFLI